MSISSSSLDGLDQVVEQALQDWDVPGVAVAVVKDDEVLLAEGYGVRERGKPEPVDQETIFNVGSTSKAFTAAAVALLIDDGKLNWDDRVIDHLPWFQLSDPWVTREMRVRDLLCHRVGIAPGRFVRQMASDRQDLVRRLRSLPVVDSFRSIYRYNNEMLITAGQLVTEVSGTTWEVFVQQRILEPLGMRRSRPNVQAWLDTDNRATPHCQMAPGSPAEPIPWRYYIEYRGLAEPSGGMHTSARDITNWMRLHLAGGVHDGKRLISETQMEEMHRPQMLVPYDPEYFFYYDLYPKPERTEHEAYGLGWHISDFRGRRMLSHGGANPGFRAFQALLPDDRIGVFVLSNQDRFTGDEGILPVVVATVLDRLLGTVDRDWNTQALEVLGRMEDHERQQRGRRDATRDTSVQPSREIGDFAGVYQDQYADILASVSHDDGNLTLRVGRASWELAHWRGDTFQMRSRERWLGGERGDSFLTFEVAPSGDVKRLRFEDGVNSLTKRSGQ
jgi:CubicO group peptidase (beta-lactamase class C family)